MRRGGGRWCVNVLARQGKGVLGVYVNIMGDSDTSTTLRPYSCRMTTTWHADGGESARCTTDLGIAPRACMILNQLLLLPLISTFAVIAVID